MSWPALWVAGAAVYMGRAYASRATTGLSIAHMPSLRRSPTYTQRTIWQTKGFLLCCCGCMAGRLVILFPPLLFAMQVCKSGQNFRKIWLTRHGQSEYNRSERLGGDSSISEDGEKYAALLPAALLSRLPQVRADSALRQRAFDTLYSMRCAYHALLPPPMQNEKVSMSVWTSTLRRTIQTARNLPFPKLQVRACMPNHLSIPGLTGIAIPVPPLPPPLSPPHTHTPALHYFPCSGRRWTKLTQGSVMA
jgi:hypothetical protein